MSVELVTIPGVPIVRVGTYDLSTGTRTFTEEDLRAAADALANDAGVKVPRIKIASLEQALGLDPMAHGGEPAFGWADNLRVSANGQELLADMHVPEWLRESMEWAYPSLSIEGTAPGWTSATGRSHEFVVTAVALLGTHWPGVTTLEDFREVLATGIGVEVAADDGAVLATVRQRPTEVAASLDQDLVARRFYDALESGEMELPEGVESQWDVWIRSMRFDDAGRPYLKVTDEASGRLYRVDFTVKGSEVSYGGWQEVVEQDVPVAAGVARPAAALAQWASRDDSRAVRATNHQEGDGMTPEQIATLARAHGLDPATATEADVMAAAQAAADARQNDPGSESTPAATPEAGQRENETPPETPPAEREPEPVAARTVEVSRARYEADMERLAALEARAQADDEARARAHRDGLVTAALGDGRITPAEREAWRQDLDRWPEATEAALNRLSPGRVPVAALGHNGAGEGVADDGGEGTGWFNFDDGQGV